MRVTRRQLRRIIREMALDAHTGLLPTTRNFVTYGPGKGRFSRYNREEAALVKDRRQVMDVWRRLADHDYFNDPSKIKPVHFLGAFAVEKGLSGYFDVNRQVNPGIQVPSKTAFSAYGYVNGYIPTSPRVLEQMKNTPHFTFKKGYHVSWASFIDSLTERISDATPEDVEYYAQSGLPKRPGHLWRPGVVPLNEDDVHAIFAKNAQLRKNGRLGELIIDNWIVDTYYGPEADRQLAEDLGLNFVAL